MDEAALLADVETRWHTGRVRRAERMRGGEWNDVWRLECEGGTYALRISNPVMSKATVAWEHSLLREVGKRSSMVHAPLAQPVSGETLMVSGGRMVTLFPFVGGRTPRRGKATQLLAAKALGQLHRMLKELPPMEPRPAQPSLLELDWDRNQMWVWEDVVEKLREGPDAFDVHGPEDVALLEEICRRLDFLEETRAEVEAWTRATAERNPVHGVIHGDFHRGNLLVEGGEVKGIVDWDEAHGDWLVYELGWSAWEFATDEDSPRLDEGAFREFVGVYRDAGGPMGRGEDDLLIPAVRCRHLIEVLWALGDGVFDAGYCLRGLEAIRLLDGSPNG